jgi:predicted transcriptional regulator
MNGKLRPEKEEIENSLSQLEQRGEYTLAGLLRAVRERRSAHKRTGRESEAFKAEIIKLRSQRKSAVEIAKELGVTRQYVSAVLIEAGRGIRAEQRAEKRARIAGELRSEKERIENAISRLEQRGEHTLAEMLRAIVARRNKGGRLE